MSDTSKLGIAYSLLGEKRFEEASEAFTKILEEDASLSEAYLGRALADLGLESEAELENTALDLSSNDDISKALMLSDDGRRSELEKLIKSSEDKHGIVSLYDSDILERIYVRAVNCDETGEGYEKAASTLRSIGSYRDSAQIAKRYEALSRKLKESEALESEQAAESERILAEEKKKKSDALQIKLYTVGIIILSIFIVFLLCYNLFLRDYLDKKKVLEMIYPLTYEDIVVGNSEDMPYFSVDSSGELSFDPDEYSGNGDLIIPDVFDNTIVRSVEDYAFSKCTKIKKVTVSDFVTDIGNGAFSYCTSLTEIILPKDLDEISPMLLKGCSSLRSIVFPELLHAIGDQAFSECSSLTEIALPDTVIRIAVQAFDSCSSLKKLVLPRSVIQVGQDSFRYCSALEEVIYPGSAEEYSEIDFYTDSSLFDPENVTFLKDSNQ